jgi:hypothetical protein
MDSSSISLHTVQEQEWRVDVPMRSFQGGTEYILTLGSAPINLTTFHLQDTTRTSLLYISGLVLNSARLTSHTPSPFFRPLSFPPADK